jgi:hypothetical protein
LSFGAVDQLAQVRGETVVALASGLRGALKGDRVEGFFGTLGVCPTKRLNMVCRRGLSRPSFEVDNFTLSIGSECEKPYYARLGGAFDGLRGLSGRGRRTSAK